MCIIKYFKAEVFLLFVKNYVPTLEGAVSHNVLNYQHLSIAHYKVCFNLNNYFELSIVFSAFKTFVLFEARYLNYCYFVLCIGFNMFKGYVCCVDYMLKNPAHLNFLGVF